MGKPRDFASVTGQLRDAQAREGGVAGGHLLSVQQQLEAIERGDIDGALRQAREDVELEIFAPPFFPFITRARGLAELRRAMEHNFAALIDQQPEVANVITHDSVVVLIGSERGTIRETGKRYHVQTVHRFTFVGNALAHIRIIAAEAA
jgi:ketosteroid isomerase-like protein